MTTTATKNNQTTIIQSLNIKDLKLVKYTANSNRANIFYEVLQGPNKVMLTSLMKFLSPIANELITTNVKMPVYYLLSLVLCGVGYAFLDRKVGDYQFYRTAAPQIHNECYLLQWLLEWV